MEEKEFPTEAFPATLLLLMLPVLLAAGLGIQWDGTATAGGCVVIRVQYLDGFPRSGAAVNVFGPSPTRFIGTTNESGIVTGCGYLDAGQYQVRAEWPIGTQFGSNANLTVDSNGDGNATVTASTCEVSFRHEGVLADYPGVLLVVDGSVYKVTEMPISCAWNNQSTHTFSFQSPLTVEVNTKQYVWTEATGLTTAQNGSIVVYGSGNVTGKYKAQYYLTVQSPYGTTGGGGWHNDSTLAFASLDTGIIDYENGTRQVFTSWSGDAAGTDYAQSFPMTMDKPETVRANWQTEHYLTARADPANITIIAGEGWYAASMNVVLTAAPLPDYMLGYWDIDGVIQTKGVNPITVNMNTTHTATAHYINTPPGAAFIYYPADCYVNVTITFDASVSTAGGTNDTFAKLEWNFGDGTAKVTETSFTTTHVFTQVNNCTVTLNVTNSRGAWSAISQNLAILPPLGPTAGFIWYPATPGANETVTFDATMSKPGWNGTDHPPIVDYTWDFGDGNVTHGNDPRITHYYEAYGNYTAKLNVTDANGFNGYVTKPVRVRMTALKGDVNGDGVVDIFDAIVLSQAYGSRPGDFNWNPNADISGDSLVDIYDCILLAGNFGKTMP